MTNAFENALREILMDRYEVDINEAIMHFSTQNYAYIFPNEPYMIRVSIKPKKERWEILSEALWVDDLKAYAETVCEPNVSAKGNLIEEFEIDGVVYRACMFRTARGSVKEAIKMDPMFFICVGELLGTIHSVSTNERAIGMHYKRRSIKEHAESQLAQNGEKLSPKTRERIEKIMQKVDELPQKIGEYGLCHADFHSNNFFVEGNNIWLFDFDGCSYAHYLYDVASFVQACFLQGYKPGEDRRKLLYEDILPYFRIGYELKQKVDEHYWDNLELFLEYRTAVTVVDLCEIDKCGMIDDFDSVKQFFNFIITQDDLLDAMTMTSKMQVEKAQNQ